MLGNFQAGTSNNINGFQMLNAETVLLVQGIGQLFNSLVSPEQYMPHGHCYLWQTPLVWLHVVSDALIGTAYFSIPLMLLYFVYRRSDVPFQKVFLLFGAFIVLCGTGHFLDIWTLWHPAYWLSGVEKSITALVSCYTATELITLLPRFLSLKTPEQLEALNRKLQAEVLTRQQAETQLRLMNEDLENRVQERTLELIHAAEREQVIAHIVQRMRQTLDLNTIFSDTVEELRKAIACDRVVIYEFNSDWSGQVIVESAAAELPSLLSRLPQDSDLTRNAVSTFGCGIKALKDTYLQANQGGFYHNENSYRVINDIYKANYEPCYLSLLMNLQITAYIAVPIFWNDTLWGLLFTYQHDGPREWSEAEIKITTQIGMQLGLALKQAKLYTQTQQQANELQMSNQKLQVEIVDRQTAQESVHFLQQITQKISEAQDFNAALKVALQLICEKSGWAFGESWIPNQSQDFLECGMAWYGEDPALKELFDNIQSIKWAPNVGLPGRVWQTRRTEWLYDISNLPRSIFLRCDVMSKAGLSTGVGIPVIDGQQVIAVLVFFMSRLTGDQTQQVELISTVALQIGSLFGRKKAEGALRSSLANNTALLKALPDWKFRFSLDGTIINARAAKLALLPLNSPNYMGKNVTEVLPEEVAKNFKAAISRIQITHNLEVVEYQLHLSGETHDFEARFSLSDEREVITIIRDITERKRAEAEIQAALEQEKALSELKTRFISMASHEFRTPLTTIHASSELLEHYRHKWSEEKNLGHLKRIQNATVHMKDMLEDVLLFGIAQAGKLKFKPSKMDLVSFCQDLIEETQLSVKTHIIHFSTDCESFMVQGDQKLLRQIFYNLLSNATKYSPSQKNVYFTMRCSADKVVIQIKDEGIGIPAEDIPKVFTAFDRASNVGNITGTGLGLPIVKKAVDLHGGEIELQSELGKGSTFIVTIPAWGVE